MPTNKIKLKGIYAVSMEQTNRLDSMLLAAIEGGICTFQLRNKNLSDEELEPLAKKLQNICESRGVLFVLNDRLDLAMKINANALHIGINDVNFDIARDRFKGILGVSCYADLQKAKEYESKGADYVAFGSMFSSKTKPQAKLAPISILSSAKKQLSIPICAIGGINSQNIAQTKDADMQAVISAIWDGYESSLNNIANNTIKLAKNLIQ